MSMLEGREASEKFVEVVKQLENTGQIKSRRALAKQLGWQETLLSNAMNGRRQVPKEKILKLIKTYQLEDVFVSGQNPTKLTQKSDYKSIEDWQGLPMFDIPVTAGAVSLIRDEPMTEPAFYLQIPSFRDCTFGARVSGDSMYPEIRNGDYVICKEVDKFIFGDIYLVVTDDGQETVKYVHPHEEKDDWVKLVPYNKSVPITPIRKDNIIRMYRVKGVFKGY